MQFHIIGYGSLLSAESLARTISERPGMPVIVPGYRRVFNMTTKRTPGTNVLNLRRDAGSEFNAVLFEVNQNEFRELLKREFRYNVEEAEAIDFYTRKKVGSCLIFINEHIDLDDKNPPSPAYFDLCRKAAYEIGEDFGKAWDATTFLPQGTTVEQWVSENKGNTGEAGERR